MLTSWQAEGKGWRKSNGSTAWKQEYEKHEKSNPPWHIGFEFLSTWGDEIEKSTQKTHILDYSNLKDPLK